MAESKIPGFRIVPYTGVVYVMHRATQAGYTYGDTSWSNLGQGAPQVDNLPGESLPRLTQLHVEENCHEYGAVSGERQLREKIANFYNVLFRKSKRSKYTWENVSICGGCRVGLTRIAAALGSINMGHFLPDYTAYEELLSVFKSFIPIPILLDPHQYYRKSNSMIEEEIKGRGLKALLMSNPCNPTGQVTLGEDLRELINLTRKYSCTLIIDEAYSHYIYRGIVDHVTYPSIVSAAEYVNDVNTDPIVIVDGLTKNWRYPGWRIGWIVAPKDVIDAVSSTGSFLDGGPNHPFQRAVLDLLDPQQILHDALKLQNYFLQKRDYTLDRLYQMGMIIEVEPQGAFYVWVNLSNLPEPLNHGEGFFEACLKEKIIVVPGVFFDVNPDKRRSFARYDNYCRISFGPNLNVIKQGLAGLARVIESYR